MEREAEEEATDEEEEVTVPSTERSTCATRFGRIKVVAEEVMVGIMRKRRMVKWKVSSQANRSEEV